MAEVQLRATHGTKRRAVGATQPPFAHQEMIMRIRAAVVRAVARALGVKVAVSHPTSALSLGPFITAEDVSAGRARLLNRYANGELGDLSKAVSGPGILASFEHKGSFANIIQPST